MNSLLNVLDRFFSVAAIIGYIVGASTAMLILWIIDKREHTSRVHSMRLMAVIWAVMILFVGYVAIGIERNTVCIIEVLGTLSTRAQLSDQADDLSNRRDDAATEWLTTKDNPPTEIAALRWEDPVRQNWIHAQDAHYVGVIRELQVERKKALSDRSTYQVPESRCGKR